MAFAKRAYHPSSESNKIDILASAVNSSLFAKIHRAFSVSTIGHASADDIRPSAKTIFHGCRGVFALPTGQHSPSKTFSQFIFNDL